MADQSSSIVPSSVSHRSWPLTIAVLTTAIVFNAFLVALPRGDYDAIVVHHSASEVADYRDIRRSHLRRGWLETAYHLVISNGSTDVPFGMLHPTRRYLFGWWSVATRSLRHNFEGIHLCVIGNFEHQEPAPQLRGVAATLVRDLQQVYDIADDRILMHRDCSPTACPGRHVSRGLILQWAELGPSPKPSLIEQHRRVLTVGRRVRHLYVAIWILGDLFFAFLLVRLIRRRRKPVTNHLAATLR